MNFQLFRFQKSGHDVHDHGIGRFGMLGVPENIKRARNRPILDVRLILITLSINMKFGKIWSYTEKTCVFWPCSSVFTGSGA